MHPAGDSFGKDNMKNNQPDEEDKGFVLMPRYQMRRNALKKILKSAGCRNKTLLEIGYGAGEIFLLYQKLGLYVEGYDFSEAAYEHASRNYPGAGIILLKEMPEKKRYDYVVACEVLEHIENDVEELKEWRNYLKDNGRMIISVPAHQKRWGESDVYNGHWRRYERAELEKKLAKAGMRIEKIYTYDFPACLFLDGMRDKSRKRKMRQKNWKKRGRSEATKKSGVERNFNPVVLALSHPALWFPVIKAGELFYDTDWGSAYILVASVRRTGV